MIFNKKTKTLHKNLKKNALILPFVKIYHTFRFDMHILTL